MNKHITKASLLVLMLVSGTALAKVSSEEAAKLGKSLTPLGAEVAANASGTIPAWTGGLTSENQPKSKKSWSPC
jgi:hypothetical protein